MWIKFEWIKEIIALNSHKNWKKENQFPIKDENDDKSNLWW